MSQVRHTGMFQLREQALAMRFRSSGQAEGLAQACARVPQVRNVDVFPLREEVPATRLMSSALWLRGRLVVPRFAPAEQLAGIFEEHAQARQTCHCCVEDAKSEEHAHPRNPCGTWPHEGNNGPNSSVGPDANR